MKKGTWATTYKIMQICEWIFALLIPILSSFKNPTVSDFYPAWFLPIVSSVQGHVWWLLILLPLIVSFSIVLRKTIGYPWLWDHVQYVIDEFSKRVFKDRYENSATYHHRVTLFRYRKFIFTVTENPFGGRLLPVKRSGYLTKKTKTKFKVPDDADKAEGIAGQTWNCNRKISVSDLPDSHALNLDENIALYAEKTHVANDWVKNHKPHARALSGLPIEVKSKPWGVLILDSRDPKEIIGLEEDYPKFVCKYLGKLLEKA